VRPAGQFDHDAGSIYAHLTAVGIDLRSARHTFDAVPAGDVDAELLRVPIGAPCCGSGVARHRRTERRWEYGDDRYRPDRVTFTIDNSRPVSAGLPPDLRVLKETS